MRNLFSKIGSLDDIETLSEVLEIKEIAGKSRQPISTFCRDYHHRFNISHTELHLVISYLIEKGRLDYSQGFLAPGLSEGRNKKDKTDIAGNQAVGDESKTDKSWQTLVMSSSLSVRATNVLLKTFSSLDELLAFDKEALFGLRNCGRKTVAEIVAFCSKMQPPRNAPPIAPIRPLSVAEKLMSQPSAESLSLLPIFSSKRIENVTASDLHAGFKSETKLSDIVLSVRAARVLALPLLSPRMVKFLLLAAWMVP